SIIIDINHSSIKENRDRKRVNKTLQAHKSREKWFNDLWINNGLHILEKGDKRFTREYAAKNDMTVYNSTVLRCMLILGEKLEEWQIYKAIHSAIQRRGYDNNIAWGKSTDDKENEEAVNKYSCNNDKELINNEIYRYPCFYDAMLQGLWEEANPEHFNRFTGLAPVKIRISGRVAPRCIVEKELTKLWDEAKKQLPQLEKISAEEFLYGEYREAYGSYYNQEWVQYRGTKRDWQGVLGQKIPRFDNRAITKCRLLPKRNVCSADTIENISLTLLMQLKNFRYTNAFTFESGNMLAPYEIKAIYDKKLPEWIEKLNIHRKDKTKNLSFTVSKTDIEAVIGKKTIKDKMESFKANISGRSSFCRRACKIMIDIIISGKNPDEINIENYIDSEKSKNGITKEEIQMMLSKIGTWNNLYISDNRDELAQIAQNADVKSDILIGNITNPVVRNRLQIFKNTINDLISNYGKPDEVIFEFVRDGADNSLFGSIKANNNAKYMKDQEKENEEIIKELESANANVKGYFLMHKLAKAQDFKCIYSGKRISPTDYPFCQIDHIYPRTDEGCDSLYNKVVCFSQENQDKGGRTPYEWLYCDKERWSEYSNRVLNLKSKLGKKKTDLLLLPPEKCQKLIEHYNALAETAQVAKVASAITHFLCGWGMQTKDTERHVYVENGSTTAKIRNMYKLNSILGDDEKKNRSNPKHHALDAICISYARNLKFDEQKHKYYVEGLNKLYIEQKIAELMPFPYTHKKLLKANIRPLETIYGKRIIDNNAYITSKVSIETIKRDLKSIKNIVDKVIKEDLTKKLENEMTDSEWQNMLKNYIHPKKKTHVKRILTIVSQGNLENDLNGRERIGEFVDFGTKGTKGQFKHSKAHKGQILYYDSKNN
ncbi:MAG: hypothetical protein LUH11_03850, partial [Candidatus Gastranaerophilales bacterium]|nr:hypothetical protein [Candidatus Gastranaerophilales bacterium]